MSCWIWHWGDYEIHHMRELHMRREDFGVAYPAFWRIHTPYTSVKFLKKFKGAGRLRVLGTGEGYFRVDDKVRHPIGSEITVGEGDHTFDAVVASRDGLVALYVDSDVCPSDASWLANHCAGDFEPVGYRECFSSPECDPRIFPFSYERIRPIAREAVEGGMLYDFGDEFFGNIIIGGASGRLGVFYGESREEALDCEHTTVFEWIDGESEYRLRGRAFRYIYVCGADDSLDLAADYEFISFKQRGDFKCSNELINRVYEASVRTFHLNCREGFLDGIKRDRWVWSGDAYQSARINAYLFADRDIVQRTAIGLVGRLPIEQNLNTILDYSFLWLIGLWEYYMTYGDREFIDRIKPYAVAMLEFCETRLREDGFVVGAAGDHRFKSGDWTFIDWSVDLDKTGAVCAEQMLLYASYMTMDRLYGKENYAERAATLRERINKFYWRADRGAYIDSFDSGRENVTRHANIFAIMYGVADEAQTAAIFERVLKNDAVPPITTPYFRGYELDVLGKLGELGEIEDALVNYWGAMLELGASTIWEQFDPTESGTAHYAMYGNRYGKSLCHAWGATSIYLFGRYYMGVYPTEPGFAHFRVEPNPGGLDRFEGVAPAGEGEVRVAYDGGEIRVTATIPGGTLLWKGKEYKLEPNKEIRI